MRSGEGDMKRLLTIVLGVTCATLIFALEEVCRPVEVNRTGIIERQESRLAVEDRRSDGYSERLLRSQRLPKIPEYVDGKPAKYQDPITKGETPEEADVGYPSNYLLVWTAEWCYACKKLKATAERLRAEGFDIYYIDYDENSNEAKRIGVKSLPTSIIYTNGKEVKRVIGTTNAEERIREVLEKNAKEPSDYNVY
jgi:thioredoxin 1